MSEIKCPHCGTQFQVDESVYSSIVKQVRDKEFYNEIAENKKFFEQQKADAVSIAYQNAENKFNKDLAAKDQELLELQSRLSSEQAKLKEAFNKDLAAKDQELAVLQGDLARAEDNKRAAVAEAEAVKTKELSDKDAKILDLQSQIKELKNAKELAVTQAVNAKDKELAALHSQIKDLKNAKELAVTQAVNAKDKELANLNAQLEKAELNAQLELNNALNDKDKEITRLAGELETNKTQPQLMLKYKDEEIERYKDFKAKQSTKMIGESLEIYCRNEFEKIRALGFKDAYFERDNDIRTGSKGDFIFREFSGDIEFISIMFEMKNEMDTTASKHKNEDFFKELDKDRREKHCEYAVLVSMLEADSELYNNGIVDVSHKYPKMYVIRPQFFIPMITLLRNAALNSLEDKRQLEIMREQNIDIIHFEDNLKDFKDKFSRNLKLFKDKFDAAIDEIDKTKLFRKGV